MTVNTSKLPLSITSFSSIRNRGLVYVDKTRMIYELTQSNAPIFLSRPRRFGKSLLVSTFESLFTKGLEDFKGLEIEKLWKEDKTYSVIRFDFSEIDASSSQEFKTDFARVLKEVTEGFGLKTKAKSFGSVFSAFRSWLKNQPSGKFVLLIDEYDAPLTNFLNDPDQFKEILSTCSLFYAIIKRCRDAFRFIFITGIARFQKASIFSKMNNIDDITLNPEYGAIVGYTQEELEKHFSPYLDNAAKALGMPREELLERMEAQYDGFCFDKAARYRLYAPWSVLKFLTYPENGFENYWSDSSGSQRLILDYFADHAIKSPAEFDQEQKLSKQQLADLYTLDTINPLALLTQAGYFTIDHEEGNDFYLRYPNGEVRETMAQRYAEIMCQKDRELSKKFDEVVRAIRDRDPEKLVNAFNAVISNIVYGTKFPLKNEEAVRGCLCLILLSQGIFTISEKATSKGRADIVAIYKETIMSPVVFQQTNTGGLLRRSSLTI